MVMRHQADDRFVTNNKKAYGINDRTSWTYRLHNPLGVPFLEQTTITSFALQVSLFDKDKRKLCERSNSDASGVGQG